ncbi:SMP-30/gluconolactonase/LRE family protein [Kribbella jiaozuonensis]|uniref:SMP-30/gluconolactonase/LRE family protein n=1 Tax=Kribbella jiaozuonensis TaxID=2575441 RepID=A0A4U3LH17_9ACTN|nr:SMP-30/gluconolactonase/LRE family protein [Kribbella jiaozuonensis]TKK73347.1 SMP-30/gluconolactonase/LRE family protein [Kribbella jiaozuonensis]
MSEPTIFLDNLAMPESGRWHDGRLWFCNWIEQQVVAVDADGKTEYFPVPVEQLMGWSIDWLADGRMLTTGEKLRRYEPDGSVTVLAEQKANELVLDAHDNIYLNGADFNFAGGEAPKPGYIKLVTPDGQVRQVADEIQFPNGMVLTHDGRTLVISESFAGRLSAFGVEPDGGLSNRRVFAENLGPDGICLDAEGAIWVQTGGNAVVRVTDGGEILQHIDLPENRAPFALTLADFNGPTLCILTSEWHTDDSITDNLDRLKNGPRTGQIFTVPVSVGR